MFFGLSLEINPGRAGLEFILDKEDISKDNLFALIRTEDVKITIDELKKIGGNARLSNYSRDGKTIILSASNTVESEIKSYLQHNKESFIRLSHERFLDRDWYNSIKKIKKNCDYRLIGYCEGGLLSAMKLCGIEVCDNENIMIPTISNGSYESQLIEDTLLCRLSAAINDGKIPIVYLKHFAYDARKGIDKQTASKKVSKIIEDAILKLKMKSSFNSALIISDHNSEVGVDETVVGITKIGLIGENKLFRDFQDGLNQRDLVNFLGKRGII